MEQRRTPPPEVRDWLAQLAPALGMEPESIPVVELLDLTRDVAHGVTRPGAPMTTFVLGLAMGAGMSFEHALAVTQKQIEAWQAEEHPQEG